MKQVIEELLSEIPGKQEIKKQNQKDDFKDYLLEIGIFTLSTGIAILLLVVNTPDIILELMIVLYFFIGLFSLMLWASPSFYEGFKKQVMTFIKKYHLTLKYSIRDEYRFISEIIGAGAFLLGFYGLLTNSNIAVCSGMVLLGSLLIIIGRINYP